MDIRPPFTACPSCSLMLLFLFNLPLSTTLEQFKWSWHVFKAVTPLGSDEAFVVLGSLRPSLLLYVLSPNVVALASAGGICYI
ncbi:hypothetical protein F4778DRAFT_755243 [Xylariomycetidae sp. FL2044]|nr:hypothetical protein F4778DRAFT_755243 [Xylariomycetidae sp. FL2044]